MRATAILLSLAFGLSAQATEAWRNNNFAKRIQITVNTPDANVSAFPFPVNLGGRSITDTDIVQDEWAVYDGSGNVLNWERDTYAEASSTCTGILWTPLSLYSAPSGTQNIVWFYYKLTTGSAPANTATSVWDANYVLVDHMNDLSTTTTADSCAGPQNGTKVGTNNPASTTTSAFGNAQDFDGSTSRLDWGTAAELSLKSTEARSVSLWFNADSLADYLVMFSSDTATGYGITRLQLDPTANPNRHIILNMRNTSNGYAAVTSTTHPATGSYYHIAGTYSGTVSRLYVNGTQEGGDSASFSGVNTAVVYTEAGSYNGGGGAFWDGKIDEVRISNVQRADAWLKEEYVTKNTGLTYGSIEDIPAAGGTVPLHILNRNVPHLRGGPNAPWRTGP